MSRAKAIAADGTFSGGRGQSVGDNRRVFLTFGNESLGTFKFGRDIGLFGQNAILNDMSLLAVGGGAATNGAINTTLGGIGQGYIYTQFQPQMTYTAPAIGNLTLSGGVFQPIQGTTAVGANGSRDTGFQGLASYSLGDTGKVWAALINQSRDTAPGQSDIAGYEVGTALNFGALGLVGNYFSGEGLGTALIGLGGADVALDLFGAALVGGGIGHYRAPVAGVFTNIAATRGLVALERGPVVYTFEGVDNDGTVFNSVLPPTATVTAAPWRSASAWAWLRAR